MTPQPTVPTAEELAKDLRRGFFPRVVRGTEALLTTQSNAPVHGLRAVALAAMNQFGPAQESFKRAQAAREPNLKLYELDIQALRWRQQTNFAAASNVCQQAIKLDFRHPIPYLLLAAMAFDLKNFERAVSHATEAIAMEPELAGAHALLGLGLQAQGKVQEAVKSLQKAKDLDPLDLRPRMALAGIYAQWRLWPAAIGAYQDVLAINPALYPARETLAAVLLDAGKAEEAIREANTVLKERTNSAPAFFTLARAAAQKNETRLAIETADRVLAMAPRAPEALFLKGLCLLAEAKLDEARKSFEAAIQLSPENPSGPLVLGILEHRARNHEAAMQRLLGVMAGANQAFQARAAFHLGAVYLSLKDWAKAKEHFAKASGFIVSLRAEDLDLPRLYQDAPPEAGALLSVATLLWSESLSDAALAVFQSALKKAPTDVLSLFVSSNALARKLDFDRALEALAKVNRLAPRYAPAYFASGEIRVSQKAYAQAIPAYEKTLEVDPAHVTAYLRLAWIYHQNQEDAKLEPLYRQMIQKAPKSPIGYNELAAHLSGKGQRLDEALGLAQKAVEMEPKNGLLLDTLGWVHYLRKEFPKALGYLKSAAQAAPSLAEIRYHLGLAYHKTGAPAKALEELRAALQIQGNFAQAKDAEALIQQLEKK